MFINTASTKIEKCAEQKVYDSRNPKVKKDNMNIQIKSELKKDERKIKNIIEMYNKNRPVFCDIDYKGEIVSGCPCNIYSNKLRVMISLDNYVDLDLEDILSISIVRF